MISLLVQTWTCVNSVKLFENQLGMIVHTRVCVCACLCVCVRERERVEGSGKELG